MMPRLPELTTQLVVNPALVRVLGSATEAYFLHAPERTLELTSDTFEFLAAFSEPCCIGDVIADPQPEELAAIAALIEHGLLVAPSVESSAAQREHFLPAPSPVSPRFSCSLPWPVVNKVADANPVVVLGACFDLATLARYPKGSAQGPDVLRKASQAFALLPDLASGKALGYPRVENEHYAAAGISLHDAGNLHFPAGHPQAAWMQALQLTIGNIRQQGGKVMLLGGDHSVSLPAIAAIEAPKIAVLHFDAHSDFGSIDYANHLHHANVMRHVYELPHVQEIVLVGIRGFAQLPERLGVARHRSFSVEKIREMSPEQLRELLPPDLPVYLSIDIDVLDPSVAPATAVPEPDGLGVAETRRLLRELVHERTVVGADLVEVQADARGSLTATSGLHLLFECFDLLMRP